MQRIINIQGFDGGESDDLVKGPTNSFYAGENIEIRKNLNCLQLSPALTDTGWIFDDDILFMTSLATLGVSSGGVVICLKNGKIYYNGGSETVGALKQTLNTGTTEWNRIYGIGVSEDTTGTQYIYYISGDDSGTGKIHRSTTNLATFNVSYREYTVPTGTTSFVGVINEAGLLYIAVKNKIFIMEDTEIVTDYLTLPTKERIVGFTQFQGNFKIYANYSYTGIQYVWDGASTAPDYRQEWQNQPILGVTNDGAYDYATLGFSEDYSDLYLISGTQKQELRVNLETAGYSRILNKYLSIREGIVYIGGGRTGQSSNYGIYTYGNYYPGSPKSLVQSYSGTSNAFTFHCHSIASSWFACTNDKVYTISHNNPPSAYASSGYTITNIYQGYMWEEKAFDYMKVGFKLNGGEIKIYARTNMDLSSETTWVLIKTIDNATYGSKKSLRVDVNELMNNSKELGIFNEIQFKFLLTPPTSPTATPELYSITTWLRITNDK